MSNVQDVFQHQDLKSVAEIRNPKAIKAVADMTASKLVLTNGSKDFVSSTLAEADIVTASNTITFTGKTFDANGTGNSISNLEVADFASGVIVTDYTGTLNDSKILTAKATNDLVVARISGSDHARGSFDASTNAYPSTGGSGAEGAILKGDYWFISVAGNPGDKVLTVGDVLIAEVNSPSTDADWTALEYTFGFTPENVANKSNSISADTGSTTKYPTVNAVEVAIAAIPAQITPEVIAFNATTDWDTVNLVITAVSHGLGTGVIAEFFKNGASGSFDKVNCKYNVASNGDITLTVIDTLQFEGKVAVTKAAS
jgi:hypothetical protein